MEKALERLFKEGLFSKNLNIISNCLRTFAAIDKVPQAEAMFRNWFVKPFAQQVITLQNLDLANPGSCEGLKNIYDRLTAYIKNECMYNFFFF